MAYRWRTVVLAACVVCGQAGAGALSAAFDRAPADSLCRVWVVFSERGDTPTRVLPRAATRRRANGYPLESIRDRLPVRSVAAAVSALGASQRAVFAWANAASYEIPASGLRSLADLQGVTSVLPVRSFRRDQPAVTLAKLAVVEPLGQYGAALRQHQVLNTPLAHEYVQRFRAQRPGQGVLMGFFDTGFLINHPAFDSARLAGAVVADSDFVDHDGDALFGFVPHGATVMSTVMSNVPGRLMGVAWGARVILARTEDDMSELHIEEDNWAAALVWAEAQGVDVVNSSLGYRYDYDPPDTSYTFEDMDGRTTIVALAAREALARGMVVVSSMGNDGPGTGTLNSPADVDGVVAVGALDSSLRVASFSSRGPTADGRVKPDVSAMGDGVVVIARDGQYQRSSGTSFSAPQVAGVAALIRQCHPEFTASQVVQRLYAVCRLSPFQSGVDNDFGRGIPDALLGCLDTGEVFVVAGDSLSGGRAAGVSVVDSAGRVLGTTDSMGVAVVRPLGPGTIRLCAPLGDTVGVHVQTIPSWHRVQMSVKVRLSVRVQDASGRPVPGALVTMAPGALALVQTARTGNDGTASASFFSQGTVRVSVRAAGYYEPDTVAVTCADECSTRVTLERLAGDRLVVYPTIVRGASSREVTIEYARENNVESYPVHISIRTATGGLAWSWSGRTPVERALRVTFDCRNSRGAVLAPGTYFVQVESGPTRRKAKLLIM